MKAYQLMHPLRILVVLQKSIMVAGLPINNTRPSSYATEK